MREAIAWPIAKSIERAAEVGELAAARGRETSSLSPAELDELWNMVKQGSGH